MTAGQVRGLVDIAPSIQIQRTQLLSPPRGPDPRSIIQYRGATAPRRGPRRAPAHGASAERQQEKRTRERDRGGAAQRMPLKRSPRPTPAVRLPPLQRSPDKDRSPRVAPAGAGVLEDGLSMKRSVSPENVRPPSGDGVCRPGVRSVLQGEDDARIADAAKISRNGARAAEISRIRAGPIGARSASVVGAQVVDAAAARDRQHGSY